MTCFLDVGEHTHFHRGKKQKQKKPTKQTPKFTLLLFYTCKKRGNI